MIGVRFLCLGSPLNFYYLSLESLFISALLNQKLCKMEKWDMLFFKFRVKNTLKLVALCSKL